MELAHEIRLKMMIILLSQKQKTCFIYETKFFKVEKRKQEILNVK